MAWTQAARDAAALTRKMHANQRKKASYGGITPSVGFADPDVRARIAATLKAARLGKPGQYNEYKRAAEVAVVSTVTRNALKKRKSSSSSGKTTAGVHGLNKSTMASAARQTRLDHQFASDIGGSSSNYRR